MAKSLYIGQRFYRMRITPRRMRLRSI